MSINYTPEEISEILNEYFSGITHKQYIGSRYVPIFGRKNENSIIWDNTGTYEPLTIVLYQGNSYTSRQFVPIGIDITNTAYWANTGNYNAQVEQYRQDVLRFSDMLPSTEFTSTNTVKKYVDDSISNEDTSIKNYINNRPFNFRKMKVAVIGDSWTVGANETAQSYGFADVINDLHFFNSVTKYAKGGAGLLKAVDGVTFYTLAQNLVASEESYDIIFIVGQINDTESAANLQSAARTLGSYLRENTDADIFYIPNFTNNTALFANANAIAYGFALELIPTMFEVAGIQRSFPPDFFTSDGYHLKIAGYRLYAALIVNKLMCGDVDFFTYNAAVTGADIAKVVTAATNVTINNCMIYQKGRMVAVGIKFTYNPSTITTQASGYAKVFGLAAQYRPAITYNAHYDVTWTEIGTPTYGLSQIGNAWYQADNGIYVKNADSSQNVSIVDEILIVFDSVTSLPYNAGSSCIMYTNQGNFDYSYE